MSVNKQFLYGNAKFIKLELSTKHTLDHTTNYLSESSLSDSLERENSFLQIKVFGSPVRKYCFNLGDKNNLLEENVILCVREICSTVREFSCTSEEYRLFSR